MSETNEIIDIFNYCRTCMKNCLDKETEKLFNSVSVAEFNATIAELIMECTSVKIKMDDGLPSKVCADCLQQVYVAFKFKKKCEKADTMIKKLLAEIPEDIKPFHNQTAVALNKEQVFLQNDIHEKPTVPIDLPLKNEDEDWADWDECNDSCSRERSPKRFFGDKKKRIFAKRRRLKRRAVKKESKELKVSDSDEAECAQDRNLKTSKNGCYKLKSCKICNSVMSATLLPAHLKLHTQERPFVCVICGKKFCFQTNMRRHVKMQHPVKPEDYPQQCSLCSEDFKTFEDCKNHLDKHEMTQSDLDKKLFTCETCGKNFNTAVSLSSHKKSHVEKSSHLCPECGKIMTTKRALSDHRSFAHGDRTHKCAECTKSFPLERQLRRHAKSHEKKGNLQRYRCKTCDKPFAYLNYYNKHILQAHSNNPEEAVVRIACEMCDKTFPSKFRLYQHVRRNHNEKKWLCPDCGKGFAFESGLKKHRVMHTGEKQYVCSYCNKAFLYQNIYAIHVRKHTGEKPYQCHICDKAFTQSGHLQAHVLRHQGVKPHECNLCGKRFVEKGGLTAHSRIHTGETRYSCPVCAKAFYFMKTMRKHMLTH